MRGMHALLKKGGVPVLVGTVSIILGSLLYSASEGVLGADKVKWTQENWPYASIFPDHEGTNGPPMGVALGWGLLLGGGGLWFFRRFTPRTASRPDLRPMEYSLASWVVLLRRGEHYDRVISGLASEDFSRLACRRLAAERLAAAIQPEDIEDAFFYLPSKSPYPNRLAREAKHWVEGQAARVAGEAPGPGDACLLLFTATDLSVESIPLDAAPDRLVQAMRISNAGHPGDESAIFVRHRLLDEADGRRAVGALRQDVLLRARTI